MIVGATVSTVERQLALRIADLYIAPIAYGQHVAFDLAIGYAQGAD
jgi:hypothetical protein